MDFYLYINSLPSFRKFVFLLLMVIAINAVQSFSILYFPNFHDILLQLYIIPVLFCALFFNLKSNILCTILIIIDFNLHMLFHGKLSFGENLFQSFLLFLLSFLTNLFIYKIKDLTSRLQKSKMDLYKGLTNVLDSRDTYTEGHSFRVANLAQKMGANVNLKQGELDNLFLSALLHDIGKIGIPDEVLKKDGKLNDKEYDLIKSHPVIGRTIMRDIEICDDILKGIYHHHEFYNGEGYPEKIAGKSIPLFARIIGIADTFDALTSQRSYNKRKTILEAIQIIKSQSGSQFDPDLVNTFLNIEKELYELSELGGTFQIDPICKMKINPASAFQSYRHGENTYYFCSRQCYDSFIERVNQTTTYFG